MPYTNTFAPILIVALLTTLGGCGGTPGPRNTAPQVAAITAEAYPAAVRSFHGMRYDDPARGPLRERLFAYLDARGRDVLEADDYPAILAHFAEMTDLLIPADFAADRLPRALGPVALRVVELGSPAGDEGPVLAGLQVLALLATERNGRPASEEYEEVAAWGRDARAQLPNLLQRYTQLISVWETQARLTPSPEVLAQLAQLHVTRRDAVLDAFRQGEGSAMRELMRGYGPGLPAQIARVAPLDVASVFLREGDVASAITHVRAMGIAGGNENRILAMLQTVHGGGPDGADALLQLADAFGEARPPTALGLCRLGHRDYPRDARFPSCLARLAAARGEYAESTGWYRITIGIEPDERAIYDEALAQLNRFIGRGIFDEDPDAGRALVRDAERILRERDTRWPGAPSPITLAQLRFLSGMLEVYAGNVDEARGHFEASLALEETQVALHELGKLELRLGRSEPALTRLRAALDAVSMDDEAATFKRAEILAELGEAFATAGNDEQARRMYDQALTAWNEGGTSLSPGALAEVHARRGILLDKLGRRAEALAAFRLAVRTGPQSRSAHEQILAHLVVANDPDAEVVSVATDVFHRAMLQLNLQADWKVYLSLWMQLITGRAGVESNEDAEATLARFANHHGWTAKLASFGAGELDAAGLYEVAETPGQRAEAAFYGGARAQVSGDAAAAASAYDRVFASNMVGYFEYQMARALDPR